MAVHLLQPVAPSQGIPRAHPCGAWRELARAECGATPAQLFRRVCPHGHRRDVWLCGTHEKAAGSAAVCRECANLGARSHACPVALVLVPEALDILRAAT